MNHNNKKETVINSRPIQILPPQLANQIAAGEVVERPASVVKELVENSLDAGATQIHIEIEQGGQKRILIRDNGKGIAKEQLVLALSRHATSKISDIDDLEHITSMGFRGEALASISSVSRLTLSSKPSAQSEAWQAKAEGQQMDVVITPTAHPDGTSIDVKDLFFNTPARRKFLRTGKTEFQHIEQVLKRIALSRKDVQFILSHNAKQSFRYNKTDSLSKRIEQVCGKNVLENWTSLDYEYEGVRLFGWCSQLGLGEATRDKQYTFVNGRMMKDKLLAHAIRQVYEDTLPPQTFPAYVLYLELSPEQLDINVHPAKHEVRFHQSRQVHDIVFKALTQALGQTPESDDEVSHNYIQTLQTQNDVPLAIDSSGNDAPISQISTSIKNMRESAGASIRQGYYPSQSKHPSKRELNANHAFYQSVNESALSSNDLVGAGAAKVGTAINCMYSQPYVMFTNIDISGQVRIMHVQALIESIVQKRITASTMSQALLMPVSLSIVKNLPEQACKTLEDNGFATTFQNKKLILKKVPSELRHLPWASIFPNIDFDRLHKNGEEDRLFIEIAHQWLNYLEIDTQQITAWTSEMSASNLQALLQHRGKTLSIKDWMEND